MAQQHVQSEGHERHEDGSGCPEVHAHGVEVLPNCQGLQLPTPRLTDLQEEEQYGHHPGREGFADVKARVKELSARFAQVKGWQLIHLIWRG